MIATRLKEMSITTEQKVTESGPLDGAWVVAENCWDVLSFADTYKVMKENPNDENYIACAQAIVALDIKQKWSEKASREATDALKLLAPERFKQQMMSREEIEKMHPEHGHDHSHGGGGCCGEGEAKK